MYYRRANAAIVVYDITNEKSFRDAQGWVKGTYVCMYVCVSSFVCW